MNRDEIEGLIHDLLATDNIALMDDAAAALRAQQERIDALEEGLVDCCASLAASVSLLERSPKKAAPSDKMFDQMLNDYRAALARTRATLTGEKT